MSEHFPFEVEYRGRLWRVQPTEYRGKRRVNIWAWYRTGDEVRPCRNRNGEAGFVLAVDRLDELASCLSRIAAELRQPSD